MLSKGVVVLVLAILMVCERGFSKDLVEKQEVATKHGQISLTSFNKHINKWKEKEGKEERNVEREEEDK